MQQPCNSHACARTRCPRDGVPPLRNPRSTEGERRRRERRRRGRGRSQWTCRFSVTRDLSVTHLSVTAQGEAAGWSTRSPNALREMEWASRSSRPTTPSDGSCCTQARAGGSRASRRRSPCSGNDAEDSAHLVVAERKSVPALQHDQTWQLVRAKPVSGRERGGWETRELRGRRKSRAGISPRGDSAPDVGAGQRIVDRLCADIPAQVQGRWKWNGRRNGRIPLHVWHMCVTYWKYDNQNVIVFNARFPSRVDACWRGWNSAMVVAGCSAST